MIFNPLRRVVACCLLIGAGVAFAAEPAIIAKARAQLGSDAVLDAVQTLHYVGNLTGPDPSDETKQVTQGIEIYLQKPARQRIEIKSANVIEVSAIDGYDAWRRLTDAKDPTRWEQTQMSAQQIKQLRADVWQNLYYFRGIEKIGGYVEDLGSEKFEGRRVRKIAFHHNDTVVNYRAFDDATGKLVYTGTPQYNTREEGELVSGGIHFPKTLLITQAGGGGKTIKRTLTFDKITVNENLPDRLFAVPMANAK